MLDKGILSRGDQSVMYTLSRIDVKLRKMRELLSIKLKKDGIPISKDTLEDFKVAFKNKKNDNSYRIRSMYSYDIKDNVEYKKSQKIEKRIRKLYGM